MGLIFGGKSSEHEVSLVSAANVSKLLNRDYYTVSHFGITKQGRWTSYGDHFPQTVEVDEEDGSLIPGEVLQQLEECDLLFPVLHGPYGEDGAIQGLFEMLGKPYVGGSVLSSALCMDKAMTKEVCLGRGIRTLPFMVLTQEAWRGNSRAILREVQEKLTFPVFVKAVHLGSSIGVYKVESPDRLSASIQQAFRVDTKLIVEQGVVGRELEFVVLGNSRLLTFAPGEILTGGKTYDYAAKYGDHSFQITPCAEDISEEQKEAFCSIALNCYEVLGCQGMARIDFFLDQAGALWLNEVNPIPGFTAKSLFPKICEQNGWPFERILDKLIILGLHRHLQKDRLRVGVS